MTELREKKFSELNVAERISYVDQRLGDHPDRIKSPLDLLKCKGQKIYIVISPSGPEIDLGTCFLWEWDVGRVTDFDGNDLTEEEILTIDKKYLCYGDTYKERGISLKDYNIIPNNGCFSKNYLSRIKRLI